MNIRTEMINDKNKTNTKKIINISYLCVFQKFAKENSV